MHDTHHAGCILTCVSKVEFLAPHLRAQCSPVTKYKAEPGTRDRRDLLQAKRQHAVSGVPNARETRPLEYDASLRTTDDI